MTDGAGGGGGGTTQLAMFAQLCCKSRERLVGNDNIQPEQAATGTGEGKGGREPNLSRSALETVFTHQSSWDQQLKPFRGYEQLPEERMST